MTYLGDIALGDTVDFKFTTVNTSGVPTTLAGTPVISAYPGNSVTQLTAGITLTVDFDGVTGLHNVRVVATSGNGYATATNYALVITTGTVDGASVVGYVIGHLSIEARSALRPTVAARTLDVSAGGEAGLDWANIGSPTTAVNLSATNIDVDQVVASVTGAVASVTGNVGGNVTGSVGSVAANGIAATSIATGAITAAKFAANAIDAAALAADAVTEIQSGLATASALATVQADTDDLQTRLPAALVSGRMDATVGAYQTGLTPLQPTTAGRTLDVSATGEAGIDWANIGSPTTAVNLSATNIDVDQVVAGVSGAVGSVTGNVGGSVGSIAANGIAATSIATGAITAATFAADAIDATALAASAVTEIQNGLATPTNITAGTLTTVTNLTNLPSIPANWLTAVGMDATASAEIADSVWDEAIAGHLGAGSTGAALNAAGSAGDPWGTGLPGAYGAGSAGYILGTNLDAAISSRLASASYTAPDNASITTILADTNDIQTRLPAALVSGRMDSSVGAMATDVLTSTALAASAVTEIQSGLATSSALATVQADTDNIQTRLPAALVSGRIDASIGAYQTGLTPLQPTTAGRTLDVTATGAAGIDWANVENPTTAVNLSATNIDPDQVVASVTGNVGGNVTGSVASVVGAVGSVTGNVGGNVVGSVGSVTAGVTVTTNNDKTGYALTSGERTSIADALLTRDWTAVSGIASRSVLNALRAIRNRVAVAAGVMTVYQEDDASSAWTAVVTTDASADPVTQVDPT